MTNTSVVIVGAGQAGGWAARTLREEGHTGPIFLIGDEPHAPYERPPLSKDILLGTATAAELALLTQEELERLDVHLRLGMRASAIDRSARRVVLENGEQIAYDKLLLSTGGRARRLDLPGLESPRVHTLRTLDDAMRLKAVLSNQPGRVLIVGGGWIGLEVAASARAVGASVTVLEAADRLCPRSVSPDVSSALRELHAAKGVEVELGTQLRTVTPHEHGLSVTLSDGRLLEYEHVVLATGLIANDELARAAGIECANGLRVDRQCRSSDPDIFAAGDVAVMETSLGVFLRLESWQNAQDQGMIVAKAMLGQNVEYVPVPMVWSQQFDQFIQISGYINAGTQAVLRETTSGTLRFYLGEDSTVLGAIGMNAGRDFRFARQMVERSCRVAAGDLQDPSRPLNKLATATVAA